LRKGKKVQGAWAAQRLYRARARCLRALCGSSDELAGDDLGGQSLDAGVSEKGGGEERLFLPRG